MNKKNISKKALAESYKNAYKEVKPIDKEDEEILKSWKDITEDDVEFGTDEELKKLKKIQSNFIKKQKKEDVLTLRVSHEIKEKVKEKANEIGLPYQSYINMILYQIATGKITNEIKINL